MLGDVFESLLGAIFIDGGFDAVVKVFEPLFSPFIVFIAQHSKTLPKEPKEDLLLICAAKLKKTPKLVCPNEKEQVDLNQLLEQTYRKSNQFSVESIKAMQNGHAESTQKFEQLFKCQVIHQGNEVMAESFGNTKKQAERNAAICGLKILGIERGVGSDMF